ncbi:MAG TPA: hypothetical protein PLP07_09325 [Pyrinomonadaceae bacterium]|nr:hypothetical protein [Chloracidobacterium sp.]MBP9936654.1 hypothetical protein [Pyrinomonadaceae bacterium]MBK7802326.1 hypothetical protein [Chloracidobacterium sp.]MBK9437195.1 hypothetical protein [Chloracidobacterium sp.]MBK9765925.1 hypothetical protein [Chloracidobacterium sp.]
MGRKILALVVAMIVAFAVIMIVGMIDAVQLARPSAEVMKDPAKVAEYMANGPASAYIGILIGYIIASFVGGFIVTKMSRQVSKGTALPIIVGVLLMIVGILNFMMLPGQPVWFMAAALLTFIPLSLVGHRFAR